MTTVAQSGGFVDSMLARLIALALAIVLGFLLWTNWSADFKALVSGTEAEKSVVSAAEPAKPANPALDNCLAQRVGDVDRMKEEGILSDAQYGSFRSRAEDLCRAQHQGG